MYVGVSMDIASSYLQSICAHTFHSQNNLIQIEESQSILFRETSDDSICEITIAETVYTRYNKLLQSETVAQAPWFETARGQKIRYTYEEDLSSVTVERLDSYLPPAVVEAVGQGTDYEKGLNAICQRMIDSCPDTFEFNGFSDFSDCLDKMSVLPSTTTNSLGMTTIDGNSTTCRILHADLASRNDFHCAHLSLLPLEDNKGKLICAGNGRNEVPNFDEQDMNAFIVAALNRGLNATTHLRSLAEDEVNRASCLGSLIEPSAIARANILPPTFTCAEYLNIQDATGSRNVQYWLTLGVMFIVFRVAAFYLLRRKAIKGKRN